MALSADRTFVGFGFGPIQSGLFVHEALESGRFGRIVIAEVDGPLVAAVRKNGGRFGLNIARRDRVDSLEVGPVEILDPSGEEDREGLVRAVADASEVATAVPSVGVYRGDGPGSLSRILAQGIALRRGRPLVVYAAENHNRAAELLRDAVLTALAVQDRRPADEATAFVNTVIGKMSGVIDDPADIESRGLVPLAPGSRRAHLVEEFRAISIGRPVLPDGTPVETGITVFEHKDDLLPFEEAKLYGHNAAHALAAYVASLRGLTLMHQLGDRPESLHLVRDAFLSESGEALVRRHRGVDPLFTPEGFRAYADDLIERMLNPWLGDRVQRVARDPERKLGWSDRLIGTMRLALAERIQPWRFATGAAAALVRLAPTLLRAGDAAREKLFSLWGAERHDAGEAGEVCDLVEEALARIRHSPTGHPFETSP